MNFQNLVSHIRVLFYCRGEACHIYTFKLLVTEQMLHKYLGKVKESSSIS